MDKSIENPKPGTKQAYDDISPNVFMYNSYDEVSYIDLSKLKDVDMPKAVHFTTTSGKPLFKPVGGYTIKLQDPTVEDKL